MSQPGSHEAEHIYGPALAIRDRQWLGDAPSIAAAVAFCDRVERTADVVGEYDWAGGSVETFSS
ncbi:hypothetical protein VH571_11995 [Frondihabitans sp. 4ASC-45]|uniref:hypothetical protein n=1 Tax=Frondihabitans sp. 4ASC-45 TaxID=3111636 RepID=UPI003C2128B4